MNPYNYAMNFGIERYAVVLGVSALGFFSRDYLKERPEVRIALPDNLVRLIEIAREGSEEHRIFLRLIVEEFNEGELDISTNQLINNICDSYDLLKETNNLIIISDEDIDEVVNFELENSFDEERYFISLSPRDNFIKKYYLKALSWAKRTGGLLIEKTSYFFKKAGHFIATLQIPDRFDDFIDAKKKHIDRVFSFSGGKGAKWFLAAVFGTAGLIHPLLGVPSLLIAYMDP